MSDNCIKAAKRILYKASLRQAVASLAVIARVDADTLIKCIKFEIMTPLQQRICLSGPNEVLENYSACCKCLQGTLFE